MKIKLRLSVVAMFLMSATLFSQQRTITEAEMLKARADANRAAAQLLPRRVISKDADFVGQGSSTTTTDDYDAKGNEHLVSVAHSKNGAMAGFEMIKVGSTYYCREIWSAEPPSRHGWSMRPWSSWPDPCDLHGADILPNLETSKITSEVVIIAGTRITYYHSYVTHRGWGGRNGTLALRAPEEPLRFIEQKLWVNENGSSRRWEEVMGYAESNERIGISASELIATFSTRFHYNIKIPKIRAPQKSKEGGLPSTRH